MSIIIRHVHKGVSEKTWKHSQYFFKQLDFLQLHPLLCLAEAGVLLDSSCIGKKNEEYMFKGIGPKEETIIEKKLAPQTSLLNPHYES